MILEKTALSTSTEVPEIPEALYQTARLAHTHLVLPEVDLFKDVKKSFAFSSLRERQQTQYKESFQNADQIGFVCGTFGLGDCIIALRYAIVMARQTGKEVICQIPDSLQLVTDSLKTELPNLHFVSRIDANFLADPHSFLIGSRGDSSIELNPLWLDTKVPLYEQFQTLAPLVKEYRVVETSSLGKYFFNRRGWENMYRHHTQEIEAHLLNRTDYKHGLLLGMLGLPVTATDVETANCFTINETELAALPQDVDLLLIPDAKELEMPNGFRSQKSLSEDEWACYFDRLSADPVLKNQNIVIVRGISHPEYCKQILKMASDRGLHVTQFGGSLRQLSLEMLRAKKIVGVDSGTTHLALDAVRAAHRLGRHITLKPLMVDIYDFLDEYNIVETDFLVLNKKSSTAQAEDIAAFLTH